MSGKDHVPKMLFFMKKYYFSKKLFHKTSVNFVSVNSTEISRNNGTK